MGPIHQQEISAFPDVNSVSHGKTPRPRLLQKDHQKNAVTETSICLLSSASEPLHQLNHEKNADTDKDPQYSMAGHPCNHG